MTATGTPVFKRMRLLDVDNTVLPEQLTVTHIHSYMAHSRERRRMDDTEEEAEEELESTEEAEEQLESTEEALCVVCMDAPKHCVMVPCGHQCVCEACAKQLTQATSPTCPMCRADVRETIRVYLV